MKGENAMASLEITFMDGSNPFVKYGEEKELREEICRWMKCYDMRVVHEDKGCYRVTARCITGTPEKTRWSDDWKR